MCWWQALYSPCDSRNRLQTCAAPVDSFDLQQSFGRVYGSCTSASARNKNGQRDCLWECGWKYRRVHNRCSICHMCRIPGIRFNEDCIALTEPFVQTVIWAAISWNIMLSVFLLFAFSDIIELRTIWNTKESFLIWTVCFVKQICKMAYSPTKWLALIINR